MSTIHQKDNYFILTGAMGAGKSTILNELRKLGITCVDEPARQILAEQRSIEGNGVPECDPQLFTNLLLSRSIYQFKQMENCQGAIIYDRGVPDNMGYAKLFNLDMKSAINAAKQYQYNMHVFFLPAWKAIYTTDDERKMSFEQAKQFGDDIRKIYEDLNYNIIDVPMESPAARAKFIVHEVMKQNGVTCNGKPGFRPVYEEDYYAAFVLDLDGHNIEAVYAAEKSQRPCYICRSW